MEQKTLFRTRKNSTTEVHVSEIISDKSFIQIDIREYFYNVDENEWFPTKRGIRFKLDSELTKELVKVLTNQK
ncbi:transcriptional coactivator p15/PC4 family protein [bacterium]|nr:transcriptional coactivator p15/PC4 family protein [bacterium]